MALNLETQTFLCTTPFARYLLSLQLLATRKQFYFQFIQNLHANWGVGVEGGVQGATGIKGCHLLALRMLTFFYDRAKGSAGYRDIVQTWRERPLAS